MFSNLDIINVILFVKSKCEKIYSLSHSTSPQDILYCNNLKNDSYYEENNLTLINTNNDLTIENVRVKFYLVLHSERRSS